MGALGGNYGERVRIQQMQGQLDLFAIHFEHLAQLTLFQARPQLGLDIDGQLGQNFHLAQGSVFDHWRRNFCTRRYGPR